MAGVNLFVQERKQIPYTWTLTSCAKRTHTHRLFVRPCLSLFYTRSREKIYLSWELQKWVTNWDMSDDYTCTHSSHPALFGAPYFLSSVIVQERKTHTPLYPFLGTPEMSDKLRYEWQIILRYYAHIIHEVSLERPTTSTFTTIHLERKTAQHFLSLWTTHLQYRPKYYAYSLSQ